MKQAENIKVEKQKISVADVNEENRQAQLDGLQMESNDAHVILDVNEKNRHD